MTASTATPGRVAVPVRQASLPGLWRVGLSRGGAELRAFFRERQSVVFILAMPAVMLVLLGAIFGRQHAGHGVTVSDIYVAGLIGGGVMAASYRRRQSSAATQAWQATTSTSRRGPPGRTWPRRGRWWPGSVRPGSPAARCPTRCED
jgi:hypothetical protein